MHGKSFGCLAIVCIILFSLPTVVFAGLGRADGTKINTEGDCKKSDEKDQKGVGQGANKSGVVNLKSNTRDTVIKEKDGSVIVVCSDTGSDSPGTVCWKSELDAKPVCVSKEMAEKGQSRSPLEERELERLMRRGSLLDYREELFGEQQPHALNPLDSSQQGMLDDVYLQEKVLNKELTGEKEQLLASRQFYAEAADELKDTTSLQGKLQSIITSASDLEAAERLAEQAREVGQLNAERVVMGEALASTHSRMDSWNNISKTPLTDVYGVQREALENRTSDAMLRLREEAQVNYWALGSQEAKEIWDQAQKLGYREAASGLYENLYNNTFAGTDAKHPRLELIEQYENSLASARNEIDRLQQGGESPPNTIGRFLAPFRESFTTGWNQIRSWFVR